MLDLVWMVLLLLASTVVWWAVVTERLPGLLLALALLGACYLWTRWVERRRDR